MVEIDGIEFSAIVTSLKRSFEVSDSDSTGRTKDWVMHRDPVGTFYNYTIGIDCRDYETYDKIYKLISAPVKSHIMTFPYGQETWTFEAYITKGEDELKRIVNLSNGKQVMLWKELSFNCIAMEPQRRT